MPLSLEQKETMFDEALVRYASDEYKWDAKKVPFKLKVDATPGTIVMDDYPAKPIAGVRKVSTFFDVIKGYTDGDVDESTIDGIIALVEGGENAEGENPNKEWWKHPSVPEILNLPKTSRKNLACKYPLRQMRTVEWTSSNMFYWERPTRMQRSSLCVAVLLTQCCGDKIHGV